MTKNNIQLHIEGIVNEVLLELKIHGKHGKKFYHASNANFEVGKVYVAKKGRGSSFGRKFENIVEKFRPKTMPSRRQSFFLVKTPGDLDAAGGEGSYVYTVHAPKFTKHHFGWLGRVYDVTYGYEGPITKNEHYDDIVKWIENYWQGKPYKYDPKVDRGKSVWEYLAPKVKILKKRVN